MRRLSDARVEALTLAVFEAAAGAEGSTVRDQGEGVRKISAQLQAAFQVDPELDRAVRQRIESLQRSVPEGGREWDLLYQQYLEELSGRRGR